MIAYSFPSSTGNDASGSAVGGQRKLSQPAPRFATQRAFRTLPARSGEQQFLRHLIATMGGDFPRSLLINYYVSLKSNPFVVLNGPVGTGKAALVEGFARALVGTGNSQFVSIGTSRWAVDGFYRSVHQRVGSLSFLETLQDAAALANLGKVYLVHFRGMTLAELRSYFDQLLRVTPSGEKILALPGLAPEQQPVLPPNLFITATLHTPLGILQGADELLDHAGMIEFPSLGRRPVLRPPGPPPPVGYQRVMLAASVHNLAAARGRLLRILGPDELAALAPSDDLAQLLDQNHAALDPTMRPDVARFIANSFDNEDRGLFDPDDPFRNAQLAYDAQLVQRVLWRLRGRARAPLRRRLNTYLAEVAG